MSSLLFLKKIYNLKPASCIMAPQGCATMEPPKVLDEKYPRLLERVGHTPMQVFAGALIGFAVSLIGFYLLN